MDMVCENCRARPAVVFFKQPGGEGRDSTLSLCNHCASAMGMGLEGGAVPFGALEGLLAQMMGPRPRREHLLSQLSELAQQVLEHSGRLTLEWGYERIRIEHLLLALTQMVPEIRSGAGGGGHGRGRVRGPAGAGDGAAGASPRLGGGAVLGHEARAAARAAPGGAARADLHRPRAPAARPHGRGREFRRPVPLRHRAGRAAPAPRGGRRSRDGHRSLGAAPAPPHPLHEGPHHAGQGGRVGSHHRPREGDRAGHPHPQPQDEEQPGAHRRAGRGQDGHRRGPRPAHRLERGAGRAQGQAGARPGPGRPSSVARSSAASSRSASRG